jgi:hypothetical protein
VPSEGPTDKVLDFLGRHIESIEHLEILLLLAQSDKKWSASDIFKKIQSSKVSVEQRLNSLTALGLVAKDGIGCFSFAPKDDDVRQMVNELAEDYRTRRVRIIEAIYTRKTDAVKTFADAFKFRKQ